MLETFGKDRKYIIVTLQPISNIQQIYPEGLVPPKVKSELYKKASNMFKKRLQCSILEINSTPTFNRFFLGPFSGLSPRSC